MKAQKTKQQEIERNRPVYLKIGMILALAAALTAFEWKTYEKTRIIVSALEPGMIPEEFVPITIQRQPPPPPLALNEFRLITDPEVEIPEVFIDAGIDVSTRLEEYIPPPLPEEAPLVDDTPHLVVEIKPQFPGGEAARHKFLNDNLRYPAAAKASRISGVVYVSFVVERDGSISEVHAVRGPGGGLNEEAERVVRMMPAWSPGIQSGRYVRVQFTMPVRFVLH